MWGQEESRAAEGGGWDKFSRGGSHKSLAPAPRGGLRKGPCCGGCRTRGAGLPSSTTTVSRRSARRAIARPVASRLPSPNSAASRDVPHARRCRSLSRHGFGTPHPRSRSRCEGPRRAPRQAACPEPRASTCHRPAHAARARPAADRAPRPPASCSLSPARRRSARPQSRRAPGSDSPTRRRGLRRPGPGRGRRRSQAARFRLSVPGAPPSWPLNTPHQPAQLRAPASAASPSPAERLRRELRFPTRAARRDYKSQEALRRDEGLFFFFFFFPPTPEKRGKGSVVSQRILGVVVAFLREAVCVS